MSACGSHGPAVAPVPPPPQTDRPPAPPSTGAVAQEPPAPASPTATTPPRPVVVADECTLIAAPGEPVVTVGLNQRVDPSHAPHPSNDSERLLFRQLYETLVKVDCMGRVGAGLASSWRLDADGRTWTVTLRQDARFSDGSPVTPADIRASWTGGSVDGELRPYVSRLVESVVPVGERDLAIALRHHRADAPLALAHADLAVAKPVAGSAWPLGTRSGRIAIERDTVGSRVASVMTITRDGLPALRLLLAPGDPRDLLDQDIDLLLTRDPAALGYAATLPQFQSVPMAWQQIHVLLTPGRARSSPALSDDARQALAVDAIRGEARGARGPFWWEMSSACGVASSVGSSPVSNQSTLAPRIVYDATDDAARDLAERFVGLARASGPMEAAFLDVILPDRPRRSSQRAAGLSGDALATARRLGRDAGYVVAVDSRSVDPCRDLQALMDSAPWLDPATIVPLVDTRLQAVVRRGRTGITAEWDGGVSIAGAIDSSRP
jgi:Bacterial extracellular solute-binding proteins, family 5 Middle